MEVAALTLSNLAYRCPENQLRLCANGVLRLVIRLVWQHVMLGRASHRDVATQPPFELPDDAALTVALPAEAGPGAGAKQAVRRRGSRMVGTSSMGVCVCVCVCVCAYG